MNDNPSKDWSLWGNSLACTTLSFVLTTVGYISVSGSLSSRWPPRLESGWLITWAFCVAAIVLALVGSSSQDRWRRVLAGLAMALSLLIAWAVVSCFQGSFRDYPWTVLLLFAALTVLGGWFCRQRLISIACASFLIYWFYSGFLPPSAPYPRVATANGCHLVLTKNPPERNVLPGLTLEIKAPLNQIVGKVWDLRAIRARATIGEHTEIVCWVHWRPFSEDSSAWPTSEKVILSPFLPGWPRNWNLLIFLPIWPSTPAAQVVIPLKKLNLPKSITGSARGLTLTVFDISWSQTSNTFPPEKCLKFDLFAVAGERIETRSHRPRFLDDLGHDLDVNWNGGSWEVVPLPESKSIQIDYWSAAEREASVRIITFDGLPN